MRVLTGEASCRRAAQIQESGPPAGSAKSRRLVRRIVRFSTTATLAPLPRNPAGSSGGSFGFLLRPLDRGSLAANVVKSRASRRDSLLWAKRVARVLEPGRPEGARGRECGFSQRKPPAAARPRFKNPGYPLLAAEASCRCAAQIQESGLPAGPGCSNSN